MGVRVGSIINVLKAWNTYQIKLQYYKGKLAEAKSENNIKEQKYWQDNIDMTNAEVGEFLNIVI